MKTRNRVKVKRHSTLFIITHWLIVIEIVLLLLTGLSTGEGFNIGLMERGTARSLHIAIGFIWIGTVIFFLYYFVVSGEYKWFGLSRLGYGFDFMVEEIRCLIRGKHVPNPILYSSKENRYIEKIVPSEVLAWWGWFFSWLIIGLTGLSLVFPENTSLIHRFFHFLIPGYGKLAASTRVIHYLTALLIFALMLIHAYFTIIFGMWKSIFTGYCEEPTDT